MTEFAHNAASSRKVLVTARTGGSFTRGNRNQMALGRTAGLSHPEAYRIYGTPAVNLAGRPEAGPPPVYRAAKAAPKWGGKCPACGITRSRSGHCTCNE